MKRINSVFQLICLLTFLISLSSCKKNKVQDELVDTPNLSKLCNPNIAAFNFCVNHLDIAKQVSTLDSLGMDGIVLQIPPTGGVAELKALFKTPEVENDSFYVYDVFAYLSLTDSLLRIQQVQTIEAVYSQIQFEETRLQVIFLGGNEDPTDAISEIADIASNYNKELVIYPHYQTSSIETAEEALAYIQAVQKSNVFVAVHLCHELAAGNGDRIRDVIENVSPFIKMVSISGATLSEFSDNTLPNWYWGIKPLYMGTYDFSDFYAALYENDYEGPIAIHTWGIFNNFGLPPETHLPLSKAVIDQLANDACD